MRFAAAGDDLAAAAARLDAALAHRGPDGRGTFLSQSARALLAHRRLAIIDPSSASDQPLLDPTARYALVYNGEIYNYREIGDALRREGVRLTTSGDTEVLLHLLIRRGPAGLQAVRGMFALALWDNEAQSLLVARDRFGMKPLYVARRAERVIVASELRAVEAAGHREPVSPAAVLAFLRWGSVPPPLAWHTGVEALEPGTWCAWDRDGRESAGRFAQLSWDRADDAARRPRDHEPIQVTIGRAIEQSVAAHLVSDVPVALFLSGGLDSAMLLSAATALGHELQCFTVTDTAHDDEGVAAEQVAAALGAPWQPLRVDLSEVSALIPRAVDALDQPSIDGPNAWVISRAIAAAGVKTALSGTGADEMFGGYPASRLIPLWDRLGPLAPFTARSAAAFERLRQHPVRAHRLEHAASTHTLREHYRAVRGFLLPSEIAAVTGPRLREAGRAAAEAVDRLESALLPDDGSSPHMAAARAETQMYLRSQLLRDLDVMAMAHGLEVRVPFVDHVLLAAAWPDLARRPDLLSRKQILRGLLAGRIPEHVLARKKTGFTLPFDHWMRRELREFTRAGVDMAEQSGWIARGTGARIAADWEQGRQHWSRPWGLAVLGHQVTRA